MAELTMNVRIEPEDIANRVLDELEYNGKTIREWADGLANPRTQADRIRSMSDEELARFFPSTASEWSCHPGATTCRRVGGWFEGCPRCWLDWLKQEVDNASD